MKKITAIIAFMVVPALSFAQSIFDKLEDLDEVASVIVNKDAFEILSKFNPGKSEGGEAMEVFNMIKDLKELKMFSTENKVTSDKMETMVKSEVKSSNLTELMRVKDGGSRVKIYVKTSKNKDYVSEVLMFIKDMGEKTNNKINSVIVSLTGNIDLNKISDLADKFTNESKDKK